jgi:hypothetical protein
MIGKLVFGAAIALMAMLSWSDVGLRSAAACNKINGCGMDTLLESREMMDSGKMSEAIAAGKANMDAFKRLRDAERKAPPRSR